MRKLIVLALFLISPGLVFGCAGGENQVQNDDQTITVVTTIFPFADFVRQVGGEKVKVVYLLTGGATPHTYEPTVEQARLVNEAQLFIYCGAGLDDWAVGLAEAAGPDLILLDLSTKVQLLESAIYNRPVEGGHHEDNEHHADADEHDHGPADPHYWLDPLIVRDSVVPAIHEELLRLNPAAEEYFNDNLEQYCNELTLLHEEIASAALAFRRSNFVAFHSAWQYFASRYYLREVAVIADFPGQEPSAGWLAELVGLIHREDVAAIFAEPQFSAALAESIARDSGVPVVIVDPLGGDDLPGRESYLKMMRFNLGLFRSAME
ncbi:MAG: metal ABC transporter substrate-binding protein [Dethiobacteria bacterium]|nr:metal ABC transporter substrate-binding protein [Dethiobacteria bacterium]